MSSLDTITAIVFGTVDLQNKNYRSISISFFNTQGLANYFFLKELWKQFTAEEFCSVPIKWTTVGTGVMLLFGKK